MKLNVKRTCRIGFAFFGILLLWQVYDSWCPTFLTDLFAHRMFDLTTEQLKMPANADKLLNVQWLVGIIMACDNLAALILLPVFGRLSDRTHTKIGKRMPYILVGTFVSAVAFPFIPLFFHNGNVAGMIIMMGIVLIFMMMYRNPAVALMPDITPKPLRTKANGIINIMGYLGGGAATIIGVFLKLSDYINVTDRSGKMWLIEIPFLAASVLMIISAAVLYFSIKENRIAEEMKEQMEEGERLAAIAEPATDEGPMPRANRNMLLAILGAEFLWFMSDNAIGTYIGNYVIYYLKASSGATMILTLGGGLASAVGFLIAGGIAEKIGRKWTVCSGLLISLLATLIMIFVRPTGNVVGANGEYSFPAVLYGVWVLKGFGMALVHNCSFPMVVELCTSKKIGKFTGYYYAASMAAQTVTPVLLGLIFVRTLAWGVLPVYSSILTALSALVFLFLVKNIRIRKVATASGLEAFAEED
ncbi:MAG: MFS transporter [Clostridiales bacterium]|nr:MFS transporter [Clostridiales bacterium]